MIDPSAFVKKEKNGVVYYAIPFLDDTGLVTTAFSTREGGVSTGETAQMNLGMYRRDTRENVRENYRRLFAAAGLDPRHVVLSRQVHGTDFLLARPEMRGVGLWDDARVREADALLCAHPDTVLVKHSADCASIFLLDPVHETIALAHSGWRGTLANMAAHALRGMTEQFGTRPNDCLAAVAPSIGPCCFEVGEDVAQLFDQAYPGWDLIRRRPGRKPHVDLWACLDRQLAQAGLKPGNIRLSGICTCCHPQEFHSHRYQKGHCGLMAAAMTLRPDTEK